MKECNTVKQSPLAGLAAYGGGSGSVIFGRKGVGGYTIERSLRFNSVDNSFLNRLPSTASNRRTFTFSTWIKKTTITDSQRVIFSAHGGSGNAYVSIDFRHDCPRFLGWNGGSVIFEVKATQVLRDPSAWYHIVWAIDTTQATAANRAKLYINGVQVTDFQTASYPGQNDELYVNTTNTHKVGENAGTNEAELDGYLADVHFIDGTALDPSSFGETNEDGVWDPKRFTGSFGTNGFHLLDFADEATIGHDASGNNNDYTANGFYNTTTTLPGVNFTSSTSDYLSHPTNTDFNFTGDFTIECYVKVTAYNASGASTIAGTGSGSWSFGLSNTGKVSFGHYGVQGFFSGGDSVLENEWTHVAVARSGSSVKGFINGVEVVSTSYSASMSNSNALYIGGDISNASQHFNGVISNLNIVTGTALYTSNFAKPNAPLSANGNTKLLCCQSSSSTTAAAVAPGTLTANGSVSANNFTDSGTGSDVMRDSPVNGTESDTGTGGQVSGNYATLNSLYKTSSGATLSNGNLKFKTAGSNGNSAMPATIAVTSGKWYWEITPIIIGSGVAIGIAYASEQTTDYPGYPATSWSYRSSGTKINNASSSSYGATYTTLDVIGVALDLDNGTLAFYKNGAAQGTAFTSLSGEFVPKIGDIGSSSTMIANFGQRVFAYSAPSGFKALCTTNLPDPTIADGSTAFDSKLWTGDGSSSRAITGYNLSPDFVWIKIRNDAYGHAVFDTVRGPNIRLDTVGTNADQTITDGLHSFDSNGFTIGNRNTVGENNKTYVGWAWDAGANSNKTYTVKVVSDSGNKYRFDDFGTSAVTLDLAEGSTYIFDQSDSSNSGHPLRFSTTSNGTHGGGTEYTTGVTVTGTPGQAGAKTTIVVAASAPTLFYYCTQHSGMGGQANTNSTAGASNFDGSIQATVKANPTAGFSILTFTNTTSNSTVGHGLNAKPDLIIWKKRSGTSHWPVYHSGIGATKYTYLNLTNAAATGSEFWNNTEPTSSVITTKGEPNSMGSAGSTIMYVFTAVAGYSAFGAYTGNGSTDGPFLHTGFRPAFLLVRSSSLANKDWYIYDSARATFNVIDIALAPNNANAEVDPTSNLVDFVSNGIKLRGSVTFTNQSGETYIYAAFAENPFKTARAR